MRLLAWIGTSFLGSVLVATLAPEADARNAGIFGRSGMSGPGTDCTFCHLKAGTATPILEVEPVIAAYPSFIDGYVPFAEYLVTVTVTGGPALEWGFNFAADAGQGSVLDPVRTRQNFFFPEFSHTLAGTASPQFQFMWKAPESGVVTIWLAVNSANNDDMRFNDAIGTLIVSAGPMSPELMARLGAATDPSGLPASPFLVNGSRGDSRRFVATDVLSRITFAIGSDYVGAPSPIRYALYAVRHENRANEVTPLPGDSGTFCFPTPLTGGAPDVLLEAFGDTATYGVPQFGMAPLAPGDVLSVPRVPRSLRGRRVTFQPILECFANATGLVAGNAIVVEFAP
jgi:hypothetical protein